MIRTLRFFLLLCCCWLLVGPQMILQLGAWTWMLANYSQQSSMAQAIEETFSGTRPCELCKIIQEVETTEREPLAPSNQKQSRELQLLLVWAAPLLRVPASGTGAWLPQIDRLPAPVACAVPLPPPKRRG